MATEKPYFDNCHFLAVDSIGILCQEDPDANVSSFSYVFEQDLIVEDTAGRYSPFSGTLLFSINPSVSEEKN
ncbi:hypothetical protein RM545_12240 [Zunongwangia sp. F260]|uniref:Uncharacterized protein n=1 Tax=Autumnicola lenta TaxID=3075593 RepID=A0ABU3CM85_9FLAO|nr:hypothetical protein [Zunongwangia sp. F260]MDT0647462.1 hypothetical protein [Zunongwangia sp. F260]